MVDLKTIKEEITTYIEKKYSKSDKLSKIISKVKEELDIFEKTEGLEDKSNLEIFYNIWKSNKDTKGSKNDINSWTAYFIGMTDIKPKGDFFPSRRVFARAGFPDIDTDFDYEHRDEVYSYIIDKYGRDNVGNIGTHGLLKFKSCVTRVTKALDLAGSFHKGKEAFITDNALKATEILSPFPKKGLMKVKDEAGNSHLIKNFEEAYEHCPDFRHYVDKYDDSDFKRYIQQTEGTFANFSYHAAGICVSDVPISEIAPLRRAKKGVIATQFPSEDLESLGLIKFDVLALSTLSVIKRTVEMIKDYWQIEIDIENISVDDDLVFELYKKGNLGGVFQCENHGMQNTMRNIRPDCFDDIMAAISLYRPGPMDSIPEYCGRKSGELEVNYFHKSIEPFVKSHLEKTYGIAVYQEQIMQICNSLAGFSIADGYVMIKAIGKKKTYLMEKFENQFIDGCIKNKVPSEVAKQYWDKFIVPFAGYGFNLSHACCYGLISYHTSYLKVNYPDEFICSLLEIVINSGQGDRYDKVTAFEREFKKKMNIKFLSRDINKSKASYAIEKRKDIKEGIKKTEIRPSLLCKGLGINAAKNIEENQPYKNMRELVEKTDSSVVDTRSIEALVLGGYFGNKKIKQVKEMVKDFSMIREDMKKTARKGIESVDLFN